MEHADIIFALGNFYPLFGRLDHANIIFAPGIFFLLFCRLLKIKFNFFEKKNLSGIRSECQTVWIQISNEVLLGMIWVQTVCKSYQQTILGDKKLMPSETQYGHLFTKLNQQIIINPDNIIILLKGSMYFSLASETNVSRVNLMFFYYSFLLIMLIFVS